MLDKDMERVRGEVRELTRRFTTELQSVRRGGQPARVSITMFVISCNNDRGAELGKYIVLGRLFFAFFNSRIRIQALNDPENWSKLEPVSHQLVSRSLLKDRSKKMYTNFQFNCFHVASLFPTSPLSLPLSLLSLSQDLSFYRSLPPPFFEISL